MPRAAPVRAFPHSSCKSQLSCRPIRQDFRGFICPVCASQINQQQGPSAQHSVSLDLFTYSTSCRTIREVVMYAAHRYQSIPMENKMLSCGDCEQRSHYSKLHTLTIVLAALLDERHHLHSINFSTCSAVGIMPSASAVDSLMRSGNSGGYG